MYLYLLIFCGIWSQGIIETFADEDIKESWDFLFRQKRVVSRIPGEDIRVMINQVPYVVAIKELNRVHCVGTILSQHIVITAASCVWMDPPDYEIVSGSTRTSRGNFHSVIEIKIHLGDQPLRVRNGIGLLKINPPFVYNHYCQAIQLHTGPLLPGTHGKISGWGYNYRGSNRGIDHYHNLQSIQTPIIAHQDCVNRYRPHHNISEKEVCTFDPQRNCAHSDFGAGLIVDGYLAGVFLGSGLVPGQIDSHYPDVFAVLQHSEYNQWIRRNIRNM